MGEEVKVEEKVEAKVEEVEKKAEANKKLYLEAKEIVEHLADGSYIIDDPQVVEDALRSLARFLIVTLNQQNLVLHQILNPPLYVPQKKRIVVP